MDHPFNPDYRAPHDIPHETCMPCYEGATVHQDWHPTRGALLKIGAELTARIRAREDRAVALMSDSELVAYGQRMRRLLVVATGAGWPDEAVGLVAEWLAGSEKEWRWRTRAASLGADPVVRSAGTWSERIERLKREVDLVKLIAWDVGEMWMVTSKKWQCRCPFHDDRHPSLDIDVDKGVWLCRSCNVGGDAIRYVELKMGLGFTEAVTYLEERGGILPPRQVVE